MNDLPTKASINVLLRIFIGSALLLHPPSHPNVHIDVAKIAFYFSRRLSAQQRLTILPGVYSSSIGRSLSSSTGSARLPGQMASKSLRDEPGAAGSYADFRKRATAFWPSGRSNKYPA